MQKTETPVVSNNSAHRWTPDVPMMVPEINPEHVAVIESQKKRLGTKRGFVAVKPNCSIQSYAPVLTAWKEFEPYEVVATTYQAISGAGKTFADWPEMVGNIIPYIGGEEEEKRKGAAASLGVKWRDGVIVPAQSPVITCQCIRVPVLNGHTAAVFVKFKKKPTKEELIDRLVHFSGEPQRLELPSAPKQFIQYLEEDNRPQIALDVNYENGMGISVGRLREDTVYDWKFVGLSHNTVRGAAGGRSALCRTAQSTGIYHKEIKKRDLQQKTTGGRSYLPFAALQDRGVWQKVIYRRETECGPGVCKSAEISDEPQGWLSGIGRGDCDLVRWSSGYDEELSGSVRYQI